MARLARLALEGVPCHVIQRGNNRQVTFFSGDDYAVYLDRLKDYADKYQVAVHAFVLMTNHVHLLMTPTTKTGIAQVMQSLGRFYVRYINQTYQRSGTLWEGRYKSTLVDEERYFLTVSRYIELNPVRAGMVDHPADYPWSSYSGNAGDKKIALLSPHACYQALGQSSAERRTAYAALFQEALPDKTLEDIRSASNKGWVLGREDFKQQIAEALGRRTSPAARGGDRKSEAFKKAQGQRRQKSP
ncbi:MAG: transposase [Alphaproteobacteria bacterium]|nr:MAG: transposase [Alphaproteobacteria bacterium]